MVWTTDIDRALEYLLYQYYNNKCDGFDRFVLYFLNANTKYKTIVCICKTIITKKKAKADLYPPRLSPVNTAPA